MVNHDRMFDFSHVWHFVYICLPIHLVDLMINVGKYTRHGSYGFGSFFRNKIYIYIYTYIYVKCQSTHSHMYKIL